MSDTKNRPRGTCAVCDKDGALRLESFPPGTLNEVPTWAYVMRVHGKPANRCPGSGQLAKECE